MSKTKLREGGIYSLTDKREFVVCKSLTTGVGYLLYNAEDRRRTGAADYRVHEDGRLSSQGRITRWRVEHLSDTGRTIDHFNNLSAATRGKPNIRDMKCKVNSLKRRIC